MAKNKFKQTEIGMIPEDWGVKKIENLFEIFVGGDAKKLNVSKHKDEKYKYPIFSNSLQDKGLYGFSDKYQYEPDCITITSRGEVGRAEYRKVHFNAIVRLLVLKPKVKVSSYFMANFINSKLSFQIVGSAVNQLTAPMISDFFVACPPFNEQQSIAKILSDLDSQIEMLQQQNETLEAIGKALFKHWFVDFEFPNEEGKPYKSSGGKMVDFELGVIPNGWRVSRIGDEFETVLGGTPSTTIKSYWENGTIAWINSGRVNEFRITEPTAYITEQALNKSATKLIPKGTTVLAITGATLGQVSRIEIDACANQSVIGIVESENIHSEYIYFWIKYTIGEIIRHQTGGAQQHINKNNVNSSKILIPSEKIIKEYQNGIKPIFDKISLACFEIKNLSEIRDSLLPKLMSGKIRVPVEVRT